MGRAGNKRLMNPLQVKLRLYGPRIILALLLLWYETDMVHVGYILEDDILLR
jgi:hypothetical protein